MCKIEVPYQNVNGHWLVHLSQFQSLTMALQDVKQLSIGNNLYYVLDGYDFNQWFYQGSTSSERKNPYHDTIRRNWNTFFKLSDGVRTCAVLSPFTLFDFFRKSSRMLDTNPFSQQIQQHPEITELIEKLYSGEQTYVDLPLEQQEVIRNLVAQVLDLKNSFDFFSPKDVSSPNPFKKVSILRDQGKIKEFEPPIPAAQVGDLLEYDLNITRDAIKYLRNRRSKQFGQDYYLSSSADAYHYILIQNIRQPWSAQHVIPNLTSSGLFSRNAWYLLKSKSSKLPELNDLTIFPDWSVRAGDVPAMVLSALALCGEDNVGEGDRLKTIEFLEDARSTARMIKQQLYDVLKPLGTLDKHERERLWNENPQVEVSSQTIVLIKLLQEQYIKPLASVVIDSSQPYVNNRIPEVDTKKDIEMLRDYFLDPEKLENEKREAVNEVNLNIKDLKINLGEYILPMGEGVDEIAGTIKRVLGVSIL